MSSGDCGQRLGNFEGNVGSAAAIIEAHVPKEESKSQVLRSNAVMAGLVGTVLVVYGSYKIYSNRCPLG